ncbi:copper fist DNA binding domain-containing protein [Lactifluus volemus]|nr:copper fist DNA binding domain-containing protein [Lactifluus volemus]
MVFINSQKFACESCIKGHRSSSCTHTERPLYEIKKKGRPISQCERCRQLRDTKKMHSKCTCSEASSSRTRQVTDKVFGTKRLLFIFLYLHPYS